MGMKPKRDTGIVIIYVKLFGGMNNLVFFMLIVHIWYIVYGIWYMIWYDIWYDMIYDVISYETI